MRTLLIPALVALVATGCSKPEAPTSPVDVLANATGSATPESGEYASRITLDQMLARTMNRFARLDLNGDGKLSQDELNAATEGGDQTEGNVQQPRDGRSIRAFERADANGDGVVTRQEAEAQTRDRFKRLDADADGKVSRDELPMKGRARSAVGR